MIALSDGSAWARFGDQGQLLAIGSGAERWDFTDPAAGWSVQLERGGRLLRAAPPAGAGRIEKVAADELTVRYDRIRTGDGLDVPMEAALTWTLADGLLGATIRLRPSPGALDVAGLVLHAVVLPDVVVPYGAGRTSLIVPRETGWEITPAVEGLFTGPKAPGKMDFSTEMQFYAWIEDGRGLYSDCRDEQGRFKSWSFSAAGPGGFRLQVRHLTPRDAAGQADFTLPYRTHLGAFRGGWYEAAQIYRKWAITTRWASRGPDQRRGPLTDLACWVWNRGSIADTVEPTLELGRQLGLPVGLDWYWWHKHPYDTHYPDYFPPREGEGPFRQAVGRLHQAGHFVQVYTNGVGCDLDHPDWSAVATEGGVVRRNGELSAHVVNPFIPHRMTLMCRAYQPWHRVVEHLTDQAAALGLDGLYLDMISTSAGVAPCYSPDHGHAPGGGDYAMAAFRAMLEQVRARRPGLALTSESILENYLDLMDGHIVCGISLERFTALVPGPLQAYAHAIPLLAAVYHGRCVCFGSYAAFHNAQVYESLWPAEHNPDPRGVVDWAGGAPQQFALELARTVVFGNQPLVANLRLEHLRDERYRPERDFLLHLCRFYHANRDLLLWGRLLGPGRLQCPEAPRRFLQRGIFTFPGQETYFTRTLPAVMCSAWQSPQGRCAAVLINYTGEPVELVYQPPTGFTLQIDSGAVAGGGGQLSCTLGPMQAMLVPLEPS
jgi:hypothetical protein